MPPPSLEFAFLYGSNVFTTLPRWNLQLWTPLAHSISLPSMPTGTFVPKISTPMALFATALPSLCRHPTPLQPLRAASELTLSHRETLNYNNASQPTFMQPFSPALAASLSTKSNPSTSRGAEPNFRPLQNLIAPTLSHAVAHPGLFSQKISLYWLLEAEISPF